MRTTITRICLSMLLLSGLPGGNAVGAEPPAGARTVMLSEIARGGGQILQCVGGKNSDRVIVDCLKNALETSIRDETDSLPFLVGLYYVAWTRLTASEPVAGLKENWQELSLRRFGEMRKETGLTNKEISEAAGIDYSAVQGELP